MNAPSTGVQEQHRKNDDVRREDLFMYPYLEHQSPWYRNGSLKFVIVRTRMSDGERSERPIESARGLGSHGLVVSILSKYWGMRKPSANGCHVSSQLATLAIVCQLRKSVWRRSVAIRTSFRTVS